VQREVSNEDPDNSNHTKKCADNLNTTQTPECTKGKYNAKIKSERVSPKVPPTTYVGWRMK
jgi:hypothetical protein